MGNRLAGIYSAGANHVRRIFIGIDDAVLLLQEYGEDAVTLATVEGSHDFNYHLFVSVENGETLACIETRRIPPLARN